MRDKLHQGPVVERLMGWARQQPAVRAMLLTSSRASPHAAVDLFSDYDLILAVTEIGPFFADRGWLEDFGRVLVVYRDPIRHEHGLGRFAYITQYEDGLKIDFTLWPVELLSRVAAEPKLPDELDVGYAVLLDKDGLTRALKPATHAAHIPAPPTEAAYREVIEEFFHEATYAAKHLWRDDLLPAKYNLDHAMKQVNLRQMLEWRVELDHGWSLKPGSYGRGLKQHVSPAAWSVLESTYAGAVIEENWEALFRTVDLFRTVAIEVGDQLGYVYPHTLDRRVTRYLQKVRSLSPRAEAFPEG